MSTELQWWSSQPNVVQVQHVIVCAGFMGSSHCIQKLHIEENGFLSLYELHIL